MSDGLITVLSFGIIITVLATIATFVNWLVDGGSPWWMLGAMVWPLLPVILPLLFGARSLADRVAITEEGKLRKRIRIAKQEAELLSLRLSAERAEAKARAKFDQYLDREL